MSTAVTEAPAVAPLHFGDLPVPHRARDNRWAVEPSASNDLHVRVVPDSEYGFIACVALATLGGGGEVDFRCATHPTSPQAALDEARERYTLAMLYITTRIRAGGALAREVARQEAAAELAEANDPCPSTLPFEPRESDTSPEGVSHFRGGQS